MSWIHGGKPRGRGASGVTPAKKWTHDSLVKCRACGGFMNAVGTRNNGRTKRWKCPRCDRTAETHGREVPEA